MQTVSNDPPPTGTRCDICGRQLTPPWVKSGPYRMHLSCRDAINDDLERKVVDQTTEVGQRRLISSRASGCASKSRMHILAIVTTGYYAPTRRRDSVCNQSSRLSPSLSRP